MCIRSIGSRDVFEVILAKRGKRAGLVNGNGEPEYSFFIAHSPTGICWVTPPDDELRTPVTKPEAGKDDLLQLIPDVGDIGQATLFNTAAEADIGKNRCRELLNQLVEEKAVYEWRTKRSGTNPAKSYSRQPQP